MTKKTQTKQKPVKQTAEQRAQSATVLQQVTNDAPAAQGKQSKTLKAQTDTPAPSRGKARAQAAQAKKAAAVKAQAEKEDTNPAHAKARKEVAERKVEKKTRQKRSKVSNYDNVDAGNCPHCVIVQPFTKNTLSKDVAGKGDGVTRTCKKCSHKWYINRKIHTCACRTCQKATKKV